MCRKCSDLTSCIEVELVTFDYDVKEKKAKLGCFQLWRRSAYSCYYNNMIWIEIEEV